METKYILKSVKTGEFFSGLFMGQIIWTDFEILARKFDGESTALGAAISLGLPLSMVTVKPVAVKKPATVHA